MVATFVVSGSCASRDIFYSKINHDYKDFFKITGDGVRISFISLMSSPIECDENSLKILPENQNNINYSNWIKRDLNKTFINVLKEKDFEYIMIDTYYDVHEGIVDLGDDIYITNNIGLDRTEFFKNLPFKEVIQIQNSTSKYFKLWKENFDLFINFVDKTCPNSKIILNTNRMVYRVKDSNSNIKISDEFKKHCNLNKYRDLLDEYIIKNFDIELLKFNHDTLADENHIWGPHPSHYTPEYFTDMNSQLNTIIANNNSYDAYENENRRKINRMEFLKDLKENEELVNLKISQKLE